MSVPSQSQQSRDLCWWELHRNLKRSGSMEVLYISNIQSLTSPLLPGASVSFPSPRLFVFLCFYVGFAAQSSPCLFFTVVYTNVFLCLQFHCLSHKPKQTHKSLFSPTLPSSDWLLRWCRLTWTGCFYRWLIPPKLTFVLHVRCLLSCERVCDELQCGGAKTESQNHKYDLLH